MLSTDGAATAPSAISLRTSQKKRLQENSCSRLSTYGFG